MKNQKTKLFTIIKEFIKYRDLLFMLILRDIRIRYKQAAMGFLWAIFMPIVAVLAGILIRKAMSIVSGKPMDMTGILSIAVKVLPWTFFISSIKFAVQSLTGNQNLVTKIYFPREVLPIAAVCACAFDFMIAAVVLGIFLAITQVGVSVYLGLIPFLIIFLFLMVTGLGLLLSSANLFFRDVRYIVEVILTFGIFFTPVFYSAKDFGEWQYLLWLNPVGSILESIDSVVILHQAPQWGWFAYAGLFSVLIFIVGMKIFHENEPYFAENI